MLSRHWPKKYKRLFYLIGWISASFLASFGEFQLHLFSYFYQSQNFCQKYFIRPKKCERRIGMNGETFERKNNNTISADLWEQITQNHILKKVKIMLYLQCVSGFWTGLTTGFASAPVATENTPRCKHGQKWLKIIISLL